MAYNKTGISMNYLRAHLSCILLFKHFLSNCIFTRRKLILNKNNGRCRTLPPIGKRVIWSSTLKSILIQKLKHFWQLGFQTDIGWVVIACLIREKYQVSEILDNHYLQIVWNMARAIPKTIYIQDLILRLDHSSCNQTRSF